MSKETTGGAFEALLAEISGESEGVAVLAKAMDKSDTATIEAAAAEGAEGERDEDGKLKKKGELDTDGEPMGKALKVIGADGEETTGFDATDLIKSLVDKVETIEANSGAATKALLEVVKGQGLLIKSLVEKVETFGAKGGVRRSAIVSAEARPAGSEVLSKALGAEADADKGMPKEEFFAKALIAASEDLCSYRDVNHSETLVNKGGVPLPNVIAAVQKVAARATA